MTSPLDALSHLTYELRYNPNCPSPYLIVLLGDAPTIEREDIRNIYAPAKTLEMAVHLALFMDGERRRERIGALEDDARVRRVAYAEHAVRGVVWA